LRPIRAASCWTGQSLQCVWTLLGLPQVRARRLRGPIHPLWADPAATAYQEAIDNLTNATGLAS